MLICSNQGGLILGLSPHLVCNWPCCCEDDAEGWADCWRLSSIQPAGGGLWGKSNISQQPITAWFVTVWYLPPEPHCLSYSISFSLFLVDSLFVMNINIGWRLPDAQEWGRKEEEGGRHDWNSSEPSGSNLQKRGNGFRLLLFALALRFVWNFSPHGSHSFSVSLCGYRSADPQLIDLAAHTISARGVNLISPHKHKTSVLLALIKPADHLSEKPYSRQQRGSLVWRSSKSAGFEATRKPFSHSAQITLGP